MIVRRGIIMCRSAFIRSKGRASEAPCLLAVGAPSSACCATSLRATPSKPQPPPARSSVLTTATRDRRALELHPTLPATSHLPPGGSHSREPPADAGGSSARTRPRSRRALAACSTTAKTIAQRSRPPAVHSVHRSNQHKRGSPTSLWSSSSSSGSRGHRNRLLRGGRPPSRWIRRTIPTVRRSLPGTLRASANQHRASSISRTLASL